MNVNSLCRVVQYRAFLEKVAQEEDQDSGLLRAAEGLAIPTMAGIGGYGLAHALGQGKWTGLPDWLVGPAFGIGVGVPAYRGIKSLIRRAGRRRSQEQGEPSREEQAALEQEIANQMAMEEQSRAMLESAMLGQMPPRQQMQMMGGGKMKRAAEATSIPMDQVDAQYQQLLQQQAQKAQQSAQQQMQQAVIAQTIRAQFRGLQQQKQQQAKQLQKMQGG